MAAQFIGAHMLVTLHHPPTRLRGVVTDVRSGHSLTLSNVWSADTNAFVQASVVIEASNVANLVEVVQPPVATNATAAAAAAAATNSRQKTARPTPPSVAPQLIDPAIVAMSKPPPGPRAQPNTGEKRESRPASRGATPVAAVTGPLTELTINAGVADQVTNGGESDAAATVKGPSKSPPPKKKGRRTRAAKGGRAVAAAAAPEEPQVVAGSTGRQTPTVQGSKGWRQTPMLEDMSSFQPYNSLRRKTRGRKGNSLLHADNNGWASEDVTDVQEMGEFDFEGSLAKFDKHTLFNQMKKEDQVDDANRLVAHNRLPKPKPGTAGGKNLHYTENVLDGTPSGPSTKAKGQLPNDFWNSEADDGVVKGGERLSGRELTSRQSSRRGESKMSTTRRSQSRKASTATITPGPARTGSAGAPANPAFVLGSSGRRVETVSALQMINLENIAYNELGLTEEMMTENAARGLAEVVLAALSDPAVRLRSGTGNGSGSSDPAAPPPATVAVLAGNNKSGIRAVAAARHLRNKGVTPVVCVVGMERGERDLLESLRQQLRLLRNFGVRTCFSKSEFFEHVRKISIPTLTVDTPRGAIMPKPPAITLIIDALLGLATPFDELRTGEQATVYELIEWANRNEAFVLSVDVPTGIDPSTGNVSIVDGNRLYVRPRFVVAMGAPKKGLLESIMSSEGEETAAEDWKLFIADIGLGPAVWRRAGTKIRRGIDFGDRWVVEMKFSRDASATAATAAN